MSSFSPEDTAPTPEEIFRRLLNSVYEKLKTPIESFIRRRYGDIIEDPTSVYHDALLLCACRICDRMGLDPSDCLYIGGPEDIGYGFVYWRVRQIMGRRIRNAIRNRRHVEFTDPSHGSDDQEDGSEIVRSYERVLQIVEDLNHDVRGYCLIGCDLLDVSQEHVALCLNTSRRMIAYHLGNARDAVESSACAELQALALEIGVDSGVLGEACWERLRNLLEDGFSYVLDHSSPADVSRFELSNQNLRYARREARGQENDALSQQYAEAQIRLLDLQLAILHDRFGHHYLSCFQEQCANFLQRNRDMP